MSIMCLSCGKTFQKKRSDQKVCEIYCYKNSRRVPEIKKTCPICNTVFIKHTSAKFCSSKCSRIQENINQKLTRRKKVEHLYKTQKNCVECGKEFCNDKLQRKFCSRKCSAKKSNKDNTEKKRKIRDEKNKISKFCEICKEQHFRPRSTTCKKCADLRHFKEKRLLERGIPHDIPKRIRRPVGSGTYHKEGYKLIKKKGHPNATKSHWLFEHVFNMSEYLGRPLFKNENVHHKNGIRDDNRIENLELWNRGQPPGQRVEDKIAWCKEFMKQYGYEYVEIATKRLDAAQCASQKQMEMFN